MKKKLAFGKQVNKVCRQSFLQIRKLYSNKKNLIIAQKTSFVIAFVTPYFDYCASLCGSLKKSLIKKLQSTNTAARFAFNSRRHESTRLLRKKLHWLPVAERISSKLCTLMFHYFLGNCPGYFSTIIKHVSSKRRQPKIQVPKCRTAAWRNAFSILGHKMWNDLPDFLPLEQHVQAFKKNLKTHLFCTAL